MAILLFFCCILSCCASSRAAEIPSLRALCREAVSDHVRELTDNMTLATIDEVNNQVAEYFGDAFPELQKNILDHMGRTFRVPACLYMSAHECGMPGVVALSTARGQLAAGSQDRLSLYSTHTKEKLVSYPVEGKVSQVAWGPAGDKLLYVVEYEGSDSLFLSDDPHCSQKVFTVEQRVVTGLAWRPDGKQFVANISIRFPDTNNELRVFSYTDDGVARIATIPLLYVYSAVLPQGRDELFVASGMQGIQCVELNDEPSHHIVFNSRHAFAVDASPDGSRVACYHKDFESENDFCVNSVTIYDCTTSTTVSSITLEAGGCDAIFVDDDTIAALTSFGDSSYSLLFYDLDGTRVGRVPLLGANANYGVACCQDNFIVLDPGGMRWQLFEKGAESLEHLICKLALARVNINRIDDVAALTESESYKNFLSATQTFLEDLGHSPEYAQRRAQALLEGIESVLAYGQSTSEPS